MNEIARVYILKGNYAQAIDFSEKAAGISEKNGDLETFWESKLNLGKAYFGLKNPIKAKLAFNEAILIIEKLRLVAGGTNAGKIFTTKTLPFYELVKLHIGQNEANKAFAYAERTKSRGLLDALQNGKNNFTKAMTVQEKRKKNSNLK